MIAPAPAWLAPAPSADEQCDQTYFLDHRRRHRLRPASLGAAVVSADGRAHLVGRPWAEFVALNNEGLAAEIFGICEKAAAKPAKPHRRFWVFFRRR